MDIVYKQHPKDYLMRHIVDERHYERTLCGQPVLEPGKVVYLDVSWDEFLAGRPCAVCQAIVTKTWGYQIKGDEGGGSYW